MGITHGSPLMKGGNMGNIFCNFYDQLPGYFDNGYAGSMIPSEDSIGSDKWCAFYCLSLLKPSKTPLEYATLFHNTYGEPDSLLNGANPIRFVEFCNNNGFSLTPQTNMNKCSLLENLYSKKTIMVMIPGHVYVIYGVLRCNGETMNQISIYIYDPVETLPIFTKLGKYVIGDFTYIVN